MISIVLTYHIVDRSDPQSFVPAQIPNEITTFAPVSLSIKEIRTFDPSSSRISQIDEPNMTSDCRTSDMENTSKTEISTDRPIAGADADDRSSSLSEIEGRLGHESSEDNTNNRSRQPSEAEDTDAETERLEDSPQKPRKHQNVVLSFGKKNSLRASETVNARSATDMLLQPKTSIDPNADTNDSNEIQFDQTSEITSLGDTTENSRTASPATKTRKKRKRYIQDETGSDQDGTTKSLRRAAASLATHVNQSAEQSEVPKPASTGTDSHLNNGYNKDNLGNVDGDESNRGIRNTFVHDEDVVDTALSNGDDVDLEGDTNEADLAARNEEERKSFH